MDATTETIAHFIGLFDVAVEEARLRDAYKDFRLPPNVEAEAREIAPLSAVIDPSHALGRFDPELEHEPESPGHAGRFDWSAPTSDFNPTLTPPRPMAPEASPERLSATGGPGAAARPAPAAPEPPIPGSVASATAQSATLLDDDAFSSAAEAPPVGAAPLHAALDALAARAEALEQVDPPALPAAEDWSAFAASALEQAQAPEEDAAGRVVAGDPVEGAIVNGERVEETPELDDLLPEARRHPAEPDGRGGAERPEEPDLAEDGADDPSQAPEGGGGKASDPGAEADADAETIAAQAARDVEGGGAADAAPTEDEGDGVVTGSNFVANEAAITSNWLDASVFVVSGDVTRVDAVGQVNVLLEGGLGGSRTPSETVNAAEIVTRPEAEAAGGGPDRDALPEAWRVTRLDGDLVAANWIEQRSFVTDFDRVDVTSAGSSLHLVTGANEVVNATFLNEIGYVFDLVFVGGDMIEARMVSQSNALLDLDRVTDGGGRSSEDASVGDNLLFNRAVLERQGEDVFSEMTETFATAARALAEGAETIAREAARDARFKGEEALNVLHVTGDLVKANLIKQSAVVGDADEVRLALEAHRDELRDGIETVAGSNVLANVATIREAGVDSEIMAAGRIYDAALLHQAELIETAAAPSGVSLQALTSEAVAFLADAMIAPEEDEAPGPKGAAEDPGDFDVLQTMLA